MTNSIIPKQPQLDFSNEVVAGVDPAIASAIAAGQARANADTVHAISSDELPSADNRTQYPDRNPSSDYGNRGRQTTVEDDAQVVEYTPEQVFAMVKRSGNLTADEIALAGAAAAGRALEVMHAQKRI